MAKVTFKNLQLAIDNAIEKGGRQKATELAQERFTEAKKEFLEEFLDHPISKEIEEGAKTEGQILPVEGNLFSFIGFEEGENPVQDLYEFLNDRIEINKTPIYDKIRKRFLFTVKVPDRESISDVTDMPWGTARSWVYAIETGISGLNQYLSSQKQLQLREQAYNKAKFHKAGTAAPEEKDLGRSTGGIEVKGNVTSGGYTPMKYFSEMLNNFINQLK